MDRSRPSNEISHYMRHISDPRRIPHRARHTGSEVQYGCLLGACATYDVLVEEESGESAPVAASICRCLSSRAVLISLNELLLPWNLHCPSVACLVGR